MKIEGLSKVYIVEEVLGSGGYGAVARCRIQETNEVVALKMTRLTDYSSFFNEMKKLERLNELTQCDSYIIRLNGSFAFQGFLYQELELLDTDLSEFLENEGRCLKLAEIRPIAQQILEALSVLKELGITHANLKLDNIMLVNHKAQPFRVKLIDFGWACSTGALQQKGIIQTLPYRAPEITLGLPLDEAIDTWSVGIIFTALFLKHLLFPYNNSYDNLSIIMKLLGQPDKELLDKGTLVPKYFTKVKKDITFFLDLVKKLLAVDPAKRILPADALKHPFITMDRITKREVNASSINQALQPDSEEADLMLKGSMFHMINFLL
uniref:Protein kinase domain-containing protein n=1 Tax=Nothobranchius furzeri TaxID=105023 RepID=A0A8C6M0X5_NOTFU